MMPCNTSGWFDPELAASYGIADFDWSTGRSLWANAHPMATNDVLLQQIAKVKAVNPKTYTWMHLLRTTHSCTSLSLPLSAPLSLSLPLSVSLSAPLGLCLCPSQSLSVPLSLSLSLSISASV